MKIPKFIQNILHNYSVLNYNAEVIKYNRAIFDYNKASQTRTKELKEVKELNTLVEEIGNDRRN